jgi:hypothetical protein
MTFVTKEKEPKSTILFVLKYVDTIREHLVAGDEKNALFVLGDLRGQLCLILSRPQNDD